MVRTDKHNSEDNIILLSIIGTQPSNPPLSLCNDEEINHFQEEELGKLFYNEMVQYSSEVS